MSCYTRIVTRVVLGEYLKDALDDLGLDYEEGARTVRGAGGRCEQVELKIATRTPGYDIGFRKAGRQEGEDAVYEIVADWRRVRGFDRDTLLRRLTQRYAYHASRARLEAQGFAVVSEERAENGQVQMLLRRVV